METCSPSEQGVDPGGIARFLDAVEQPADPVRAFLTIRPDAEPGTLFADNQPPVLALATILQDLAGASSSTSCSWPAD